MAVRIRLTRIGRKKKPFYRIVAIDSREPRNGRYLEKIGHYDPLATPSDLSINEDRALYWLGVGAIPSDTVRSLFRREGILFKWDLTRRGLSEEEKNQEMKRWEVIQLERKRKAEQKLEERKKEKEKAEKETKEERVEEEKAEAKVEEEPETKEAGQEEETQKQQGSEKPEAKQEAETQKQEESGETEAEQEEAPEDQKESEETKKKDS